jgi:hypothetical protein
MPRTRTRLYVGCTPGRWEVFRSACEPTRSSHGRQFNAAIGPFRTIGGAAVMVAWGPANPHCRSVGEAEGLARRHGKEVTAKLPRVRVF